MYPSFGHLLFLNEIIEENKQSYTACPKKHGNSVTNSISSLLLISIVFPKVIILLCLF